MRMMGRMTISGHARPAPGIGLIKGKICDADGDDPYAIEIHELVGRVPALEELSGKTNKRRATHVRKSKKQSYLDGKRHNA